MKTDTLDRRLRFAAPQPREDDAAVFPQEADFLQWELIDRHGPLPLPYLYEATKHLRRNYANLQKRALAFYHDGWLSRPDRQFASFHARYSPLVYDLTEKSRHALSDRGTLGDYSPRRTDPFLHQLMGACVAASLELSTAGAGPTYISREEILTHTKCPQATKDSKNPMALPLGMAHTIVPDDLFGIYYPDAGYRFFAVEIDRNTESIERKNLDSNTFGRKIEGYLTILGQRLYNKHWGLPNLSVLTVTTNSTHARKIIEYLERQHEPKLAERFGFAFEPSFGANWRVPKVLLNLLHEPWITVSGTIDISRS